MIKYEVKINEDLRINSKLIPIDPSKTYKWTFQYRAEKGNLNSSFGVLIFTDGNREFARRISLIKNWNGEITQNSIISAVSSQVKFARLGFRVNCQGAKPDDVNIEFPPIESCTLTEVPNKTPQNYDDWYNYENDWPKFNLEENWWGPVGPFKNEQEYDANGEQKVKLMIDFGLQPNSTILDIGCGTGILVKPLEKYLTSLENYSGMDLAQEAVDYCTKHYTKSHFYKNEMTQLPNIEKKFDMICLFSVFTHIYPQETLNYLKEMKKYLNENGCIVASIFKNSKIMEYTGTRDRMQLNEDYFVQIAKSAGFSNIESYEPEKDNVQIAYKLS